MGLHHRLTVVVGSVAIAQTLIGGAALLASARTAPPPAVERAQRSLAAIAALELGGHVLHPHNAIAQRALYRIAQEPGIVYAFVLVALVTTAVVTVAAAGFVDGSRGPTNDARRRPTLAADGVVRLGTSRFEGTSFATPRVAAAFALVFARHPRWPVERAAALLHEASVPAGDAGWGTLDFDRLRRALDG